MYMYEELTCGWSKCKKNKTLTSLLQMRRLTALKENLIYMYGTGHAHHFFFFLPYTLQCKQDWGARMHST